MVTKMKLTEEQIKGITFGALKIERCEDGYHFFEYTEKQLAFFASLDEGLGNRAKTTTGVRLDFHTDARAVRFSVNGGGKYELLINGLLKEQFFAKEPTALSYEAEGAGPYRVTLALPSHGVGVLEGLELEGESVFAPHAFDCRLLFIGDSITQGWNTDIDTLSYAYRVSFFYNAESVIQGTGGAFFHEGTFDAIPFDPDKVIVALGTNDFNHYKTVEDMAARADAHLACIAEEYKDKPRYYISPIWRASQERAMGSFGECRAALIALAEKHGFTHIDGFSLVPAHPVFFDPDLLHPNALGFSQFSENLIHALEAKKG